MKRWSQDNPKAKLMEQKRAAMVSAARHAFLDGGYSQTSMDAIAGLAGVSVKTIYRHFENKDELFSAVMQAVCRENGGTSGNQSVASMTLRYPWFDDASLNGLSAGGKEYLDHVLSEEQLSLYRVVTRDAARFPELGRRYQKEVVSGRTAMIVRYIDHCSQINHLTIKDPQNAGGVFEALLRAGLFEQVLLGLRICDEKQIAAHAQSTAKVMWKLMHAGIF